MSTDRDVTGIVRSWLDDGVTRLPDRVLDAVLDQIPATRQRRAWWPARRFRVMNVYVKFAIAAATVVVVALIGINLVPRFGGVGGPVATPSPPASPAPLLSPSPAASPAVFPNGPLAAGSYTTQPFVPGGYGLCVDQPVCTEPSDDDHIRVTVTVPDGWAGAGGTIRRAVENNSPPGGAGLMFSRGGQLYSKACNGTPPPDVPTGTTVTEFVAALVDHPDLDVTDPVDVTLAGYSGTYVELRAPANTATDSDNPKAGECAGFFVWEPGIYAQGPNHLWHIWVLDVNGTRVVVRSDTYPGTTPAVQAQLQAIVNSIRFES